LMDEFVSGCELTTPPYNPPRPTIPIHTQRGLKLVGGTARRFVGGGPPRVRSRDRFLTVKKTVGDTPTVPASPGEWLAGPTKAGWRKRQGCHRTRFTTDFSEISPLRSSGREVEVRRRHRAPPPASTDDSRHEAGPMISIEHRLVSAWRQASPVLTEFARERNGGFLLRPRMMPCWGHRDGPTRPSFEEGKAGPDDHRHARRPGQRCKRIQTQTSWAA